MHFSTLVSSLAFAAGAVSQNTQMLRLNGVPGIGSFTGLGVPGACQPLPRNIRDFSSGQATQGFRCFVYERAGCQGSFVTIPGLEAPRRPRPPQWQSWRCTCASCPT